MTRVRFSSTEGFTSSSSSGLHRLCVSQNLTSYRIR